MGKQDGGNVYFLRHCTTRWNEERKVQGAAIDLPLSQAGIKEVDGPVAVFRDIKIDEIWSSDALRATQTANPIARSKGLEIITTTELREVDWGDLNGKLYREVLPEHPDPQVEDVIKFLYGYRKSGELPEKREERARRVKAMLLEHPENDRLIISDGTFLSYVGCVLGDEQVKYRAEHHLKNGHFHQYKIDDGKFIIKGFNLKEPIKD